MRIIHDKLNGVKVLKCFVLFLICFIPLRHLCYVIPSLFYRYPIVVPYISHLLYDMGYRWDNYGTTMG